MNKKFLQSVTAGVLGLTLIASCSKGAAKTETHSCNSNSCAAKKKEEGNKCSSAKKESHKCSSKDKKASKKEVKKEVKEEVKKEVKKEEKKN